MLFSKAVEGFILSKQIEGLSDSTLTTYQYHLEHFTSWHNNTELEKITANDIKRFFLFLQTEYEPVRWNKDNSPLSNRTLKNIWIVLKSFYTWAKDELQVNDMMSSIPPPKATIVEVEPFTQAEVKALLKVVDKKSNGDNHPFGLRNRAIILTLLDTGLRATETCNLKIADVEMRTGKIKIDNAKGNKTRSVYLGVGARKACWKYLASREDGDDPARPFFIGENKKEIERTNLRKILHRIGIKAGVKNVYPHRFRHTFAIEFLRNGGDIFTLQMLLGHSSLEMVRHYSKIAEIDTERMHRIASPVDNWL